MNILFPESLQLDNEVARALGKAFTGLLDMTRIVINNVKGFACDEDSGSVGA
jgi:hypothetical protein